MRLSPWMVLALALLACALPPALRRRTTTTTTTTDLATVDVQQPDACRFVQAIHQAPLQLVKAVRSDDDDAPGRPPLPAPASAGPGPRPAIISAAPGPLPPPPPGPAEPAQPSSVQSEPAQQPIPVLAGRQEPTGPAAAINDGDGDDAAAPASAVAATTTTAAASMAQLVAHFRLPSAKAQCRLELCDESAGTAAVINLIAADVYHTEAAVDAAAAELGVAVVPFAGTLRVARDGTGAIVMDNCPARVSLSLTFAQHPAWSGIDVVGAVRNALRLKYDCLPSSVAARS
ncbi:MAG: hypothetical protein M1826_000439 [Phylliscum demangeonii]|nr:MAG: hypothetical protein M1826_000439 [Phylliscum demangeonii]